ncbi:MAG TPA: SulP family inorganic anion transporter [Pseudolabrys sp.]|nr:SulP family inorganic anion transporter [Pseudolabrys sp.]
MRGPDGPSAWSFLGVVGTDALKDVAAGLLASVVLIANVVSFAALMFPGEMSAGIPVAIWAMLVGSCICGVVIALMTSLPPLTTGIDSPTGTVLILLSATAGSGVMASGGSAQAAVETAMLAFTAATLLTGAALYVLGAFRWGSYFRFVPYFVVGGFLAATGCFLIVGGIRMTTGHAVSLSRLFAHWTTTELTKLASAVAVLAVLLALRRWIKSPLAMPAALLVMWLGGAFALYFSGVSDGWYLRSMGTLIQWKPFEAAHALHLNWPMMVKVVPELFAVTIVALISMITKISSIEVARQTSGDVDCEFRTHGIGSLLAAPFGGITCSLQIGTSQLLQHAGGATRMSGVACSLIMGIVGVGSFNLPGLVPIPIVAGLVFYLGYTFIADALWRPISGRAWLDLLFAVGIMIVCLKYGYLVGVLAGIISACVLFAVNYAQIGVVRRRVTRAQFSSYVDRSTEANRYLREAGNAIQLYWLSGYIFFGSSEGLFERIRGDVESALPDRVEYVILDFQLVSGVDSSAIASLTKLRNFCDRQGAILVYAGLSKANYAALARGKLFGSKSRHKACADLNDALAWCEDRLLSQANLDSDTSLASFESWFQTQLGTGIRAADLIRYFERKDVGASQILYREQEPADTIDLIVSGRLAIDVMKHDGETLRVRRMTTHTVVGEMGFFRRAMRSATVSAETPTTLFTLTRVNFERMRNERPELANALYDFILRILADRTDFANRTIAAMTP